MRCVVVLGAGASMDFGVPSLAGLFTDPSAKRSLNRSPELKAFLEQTFWEPRGITRENSSGGPNIEEMLTCLREWELNCDEYNDCDIPRPQFEQHRRALYRLIKDVVFDDRSSSPRHLNPIIEYCDSRFEHTTWASFNWDCLFESSFYYCMGHNPYVPIELSRWTNPMGRKHTLLRLHGGVNWWYRNRTISYLPFAYNGDLRPRWDSYTQGGEDTGEPVILEPSYYKYDGAMYELLRPQWRVFMDSLCNADMVIIIGYSMPLSDAQARSTLLTAFQANSHCRWVIVDPYEGTHATYRRLLGTRRTVCIPVPLSTLSGRIAEYSDQLVPPSSLQ